MGFGFPVGDFFGFGINGYFGPNFQFTTGVPTPRRRFDSFSTQLRFARLGCAAAQVGLLSPEKALPKDRAVVIVG
jgi:hypothetical protein